MTEFLLFQQNSVPNSLRLDRLPVLSKTVEAAQKPLDYRDLVSQLVMERLTLLSSPTAVGGGEGDLDDTADLSLEETGGSGPSSLGSLNLSFPHQMSISSSGPGKAS